VAATAHFIECVRGKSTNSDEVNLRGSQLGFASRGPSAAQAAMITAFAQVSGAPGQNYDI
jgi:hypothetical protein